MKVIIIGGFLGSGKTSLVLQLARYLADSGPEARPFPPVKAARVVIVENEIGEVGIDDRVLRDSGFRVQGMFSGCVCCTMSGELSMNIHNIIQTLDPEYIIMEATGVAFPSNIKEVLSSSLKLDCRICCVTDAKRWQRLLIPMQNMIADQLYEADVVVINKIDLVDQDTLAAVEQSVKSFNSQAVCYKSSALKDIDPALWVSLLGPE
jgi:G3E family GTPase